MKIVSIKKFLFRIISDSRVIVGIISTLTVCLNFLISILLLRHFGLGSYSDIYFFSSSLLLALSMIFSWSLSSIVVPQCIESRHNQACLLGFFIFIFILCLFISPVVANAINLAISASLKSEVDTLFLSYALAFSGSLDILFSFILNYTRYREKYLQAVFLPCVASAVSFLVLVFMIFLKMEVVDIISAAIFVPKFVSVLMFFLFNMAYLPKPKLSLSHARDYFSKIKSLLSVSLLTRTSDISEKVIAAQLQTGFLSFFSFFQRISLAVVTVLTNAISAPTMTIFSRCNNDGDHKKAGSVLLSNIKIYGFISFFMFILYFPAEEALLRILNYNGDTDYPTALIFFCISLALFCRGCAQTLHNYCLAFGRQNLVSLLDLVGFAISITLKIIGTFYFGMYGFLIAVAIEALLLLMLRGYAVFRIRSF